MVFRRSSVVEQLTVNQLVVGSTPTVGAMYLKTNSFSLKFMTFGTLFSVLALCQMCHNKPINFFVWKIGFVFSF